MKPSATLLGLLLLVSGCSGALRGGTPNLPEGGSTFAVTCVVMDQEDHPIAGALCSVEGQQGRTDAAGRYTFARVAAGERNLVATVGAPPNDSFGAHSFRNDRDQDVRVIVKMKR
jgi:hypothetical protein